MDLGEGNPLDRGGMVIPVMLHNLLKNGGIIAAWKPAYQAGEDACGPTKTDFFNSFGPTVIHAATDSVNSILLAQGLVNQACYFFG